MTTDKLTFAQYQEEALKSDLLPKSGEVGIERSLVLPVLGLIGEAGELSSEFKKRELDKRGFDGFEKTVREELGDALWYMAAIADRVNVNLADVAEENLVKAAGEYQASLPPGPHKLYDDEEQPEYQLPRTLAVRFDETIKTENGVEVPTATLTVLNADLRYNRPLGDPIDDNNDIDDFYRFHDAFHLAHMAVLGWSPVIRAIMNPKLKRKGSSRTDRVEDGGRAVVIEEGLTAAVFAEASTHNYFESTKRVPRDLLKSCMKVTSHLEVRTRTIADWQHAVLAGYDCFRFLRGNRGGVLVADMHARSLRHYTVGEYNALATAINSGR